MPSSTGFAVTASRPLPTPAELCAVLPKTGAQAAVVQRARTAIRRIMRKADPRLLLVVGPCSIHDVRAGREYAQRLAVLAAELRDRVEIVMRTYFEKPRTALGWTGLVLDPHLDDSGDVAHGLLLARQFLRDLLDLNLPTATEFLDPISPGYFADLVCWASVGARTAESQLHRQLASGLAMPLGFKNGTDGRIQNSVNAIHVARRAQTLLGVTPHGRPAELRTAGNPDCHLVLRGSALGPNYAAADIAAAEALLAQEDLPCAIMVDCSHDNSGRRPERQAEVARDVLRQLAGGNRSIFGIMLESHLAGGRQPLAGSRRALRYGVSITDACLDWAGTERCLRDIHEALAPRFAPAARTRSGAPPLPPVAAVC